MTPDPNSDLVGYRFPVDSGGEGVVTATASWSEGVYVTVATPAGVTARVASQVRRRKELSS
jgi:hypothetical protein